MRILSFQDMPVIFNAPHVDRITGNMQITQTRFGRFNVLLTFSRPNIRPEPVATLDGHSESGRGKDAKVTVIL